MNTVIIDIDGTIRDTSRIVHLVTSRPRRHEEFYAACADCPPIIRVVRTINERYPVKAWHRVIATGQPERFRASNARWVAANFGHVHWMCMRQEGDYRKAPDVKRDMLARMRAYGYRPTEAWDDDPAVIEMYAENGVDGHEVYRSERFTPGVQCDTIEMTPHAAERFRADPTPPGGSRS